VSVVTFGFAGPAHAIEGVFNQVFGRVQNGYSGRCLDSGTVDDTLLFNCSTSIYQQWVWIPDNRAGAFNLYTIQGHDPVGCLDAGDGLNGTLVPMKPCDGSQRQKWGYMALPYPFPPSQRTYQIINSASGRCLDADLGSINRGGTKVQLWDCNQNAYNQKWYFEHIWYY
jgi:hypothetical protein